MYNFSVPMALVDYVPVVLFLIAALILHRDLYNKMSKGCFALFAAGTIDVFLAGALQATWKLLYAAGICDFQALNTFFLPAQSIGFLLAGLAVIFVLRVKPKEPAPAEESGPKPDDTGLEKYYQDPAGTSPLLGMAAAPAVFKGNIVFIGIMVLGLAMVCGGLSVLASSLKKKTAAIFFLLTFVLALGMGYISTLDMTSAVVNWAEQGINIASQLTLLIGVVILHRAGLEKYGVE